jgi:hypothetical protein
MLTIEGRNRRFCDGINRRQFLRIGALGGALTLADMLRARGAGQQTRRKSAIMVYLGGGPAHLDTYDLKPDAPVEFRGEFRPVATNVPGVRFCELFPLQAQMFDKLAVLRAVVSPVDEHTDVTVMTGYRSSAARTGGHPSFGSVVSRIRGTAGGMPPFVSLRGMTPGTEPGFLGVAHRPFTPTGPGVADLRLPTGVTAERMAERRQLLEGFDTLRRDIDASGTMAGLDAFQQQAFDLVTSGRVRNALSLAREEPRTMERYSGVEQFLKARRLVEAGVGCVTLSVGSWDTHRDHFSFMRNELPFLDRGVSALVQDLHERGLSNDVVIVVWGEFGRTPRINREAGRDHWAPAMSALLAGGGLRMGQAVGSTSARGEQPRERPCTVSQVLATLYRAIGIDPAMTFPNASGRPVHVLEDREPIRELV